MIATELETARKQLLDLTTRNRLLSIPQTERARVIRMEDEISDEILRILVSEGRRFSFLPRPEIPPLTESTETSPSRSAPPSKHTDTKLQTFLSPQLLRKRLLSFYLDARTAIEEQGVNTLYLALGQLQWRDDPNSDTDRFAPIILVPVELQRTNAREAFRLVALDQDPSGNLSLIAKLAEQGIRVPEFEWSDDFTPSDYFDQLRDYIPDLPGWEIHPNRIVLGFFSFAKFLMYRDLDPINWPAENPLADNPLIQGLIGPGFPASSSCFSDDAYLDELVPVEQLNHVVDADSSQALAVEEIRAGNNLIIQGPPGTGKSQTITNLIATAVIDGKRVLFVADKLAALEVVYRRLNAIGLGSIALELHSHRANKREILEELKRTLSEGRPHQADYPGILDRLRDARRNLNQHARLANTPRPPANFTPVQVLGEMALREGSIPLETLPDLDQPDQWTRETYLANRNRAGNLAARIAEIGLPNQHPWFGVSLPTVSRFDIESITAQIPRTIKVVDRLAQTARRLAEDLGKSPPQTSAEVPPLCLAAHWIAAAPNLDRAAIIHSDWQSSQKRIQDFITFGNRLRKLRDEHDTTFSPAAWKIDVTSIRLRIAAHGRSIFRFLNRSYRAAVAEFRSLLRNPDSVPKADERLKLLDILIEAHDLAESVKDLTATATNCLGSAYKGLDSDGSVLQEILDWYQGAASAGLNPEFFEIVARTTRPTEIGETGLATETALTAANEQVEILSNDLQLDPTAAFDAPSLDGIPFPALLDKLALWQRSGEKLSQWVPFYLGCREAHASGIGSLADRLIDGRIGHENALNAYDLAYFRQIYRCFLTDIPELARFDGHEHNRLVEHFRELDRTRIAIARTETLLKHRDGLPLEGGFGAVGILRGEMNKKRNHMPVRKLLATTGSAVQAIKPVFMMSPLSVAQFLEPGKLDFDLVIFDEASQVLPVDALGAIARGKQLVVVGDDRQLPPTRFFSRFAEENIPDDAEESSDGEVTVSAGDLESILGLAATKGIPDKMLRWHYRSKHPSLIAVSNYQFYDSRLFIIPTPNQGDPDLGLGFHHIPDGVFDRGKSMRNPVEAAAVARAVIEHARRRPEQSLGVAAFSVSQRDAILDELERLQTENPDTETFFHSHPHEPFFVKNLENVQGDERDCIFISVGYAKDANGFFSMNFGPLNREGGERRLNVLISRSKRRCEVFSSILPGEIDLNRSRATGVIALKTFLQYAESGILGSSDPQTDRGIASPLEASIKRALEREGYTVHPQVGSSGFYVDLAIVDPAQPGRYLIGIECDGASYHSARSARERDRQRQAVLEAHGWQIHRIWSTDWFNRPSDELRKALTAIESARLRLSGTAKPPADLPPIEPPKREDPPANPAPSPDNASIPYVCAKIRPDSRRELHEVPTDRLAKLALKVISIESPVHRSEIITRLREAWGLQRTGTRITACVDEALDFLLRNQTVSVDDDFFSIPGQTVIPRNREAFSGSSIRNHDRIASSEYQAAIHEVVRESHGIPRDELIVGVARKLGFATTSRQLADRIDQEMTTCETRGTLRHRGDYLISA